MSTENIKLLIIGVSLTFVAQVAVWFQHNWQFVNKKFGPECWPNRFIGFTIGVITYVYLTTYYLDEPVSWKIAGQLLLCFGIVLIQIFWK